jgi:hypothetical protein
MEGPERAEVMPTLSMEKSGKAALPPHMQTEFEQMWHARPDDRADLEDFRDSVMAKHYELPEQPNLVTKALHYAGIPLSYAAGVARTGVNAVESMNPVVTAARALLEGHAVGGGSQGDTYVTGGGKIPPFIPAPNVTFEDAANALKGKAPGGSELLERQGMPEDYAKILGLGEDVALDPLGSSELPMRSIPYLGKSIDGVSDMGSAVGRRMYDAAFKGPLKTLQKFHAKEPEQALDFLRKNRVGADWTTMIPEGLGSTKGTGWKGFGFEPRIGTEGDMISQVNEALQPARRAKETLESEFIQGPGGGVIPRPDLATDPALKYVDQMTATPGMASTTGLGGKRGELMEWANGGRENFGDFKRAQQEILHPRAYPDGEALKAGGQSARDGAELYKQLYNARQRNFYDRANQVREGLGTELQAANRELSLGSSAADAIESGYAHNHKTDWLDMIPGGRELGTPVLTGVGLGLQDLGQSGMLDSVLRNTNYEHNVAPANNPWRF